MRNSSDQKLVSSSGMKHETKHSRVNRVTADWSLDSQVSPGSPKVGKTNPALQPVTQAARKKSVVLMVVACCTVTRMNMNG